MVNKRFKYMVLTIYICILFVRIITMFYTQICFISKSSLVEDNLFTLQQPKYFWKLAHVIPIFKSGDKSLVSNYRPRPIALLCTFTKIFEKVVCKYIFNFLVDNSLIYKFQSGFIAGHSTSHQLIELMHEIMQSLDNQELICLIFL